MQVSGNDGVMLNPTKLVVFEEPTEVFVLAENEPESGERELVERVAAREIQEGYWLPPENDRAAHKAVGGTFTDKWVYYPPRAVAYVVDLTDAELRPVHA